MYIDVVRISLMSLRERLLSLLFTSLTRKSDFRLGCFSETALFSNNNTKFFKLQLGGKSLFRSLMSLQHVSEKMRPITAIGIQNGI